MNNLETGTLLSFIAEGLVLFDGNGQVTMVNPHASLLLDYTADEFVGKNIDTLFEVYLDDYLIPESERIANAVFILGEPFKTPRGKTVYFKSKSGKKFPVFISAKAIKTEEKTSGVLIFRDITIEKELENYKINTAKRLSELTPILQQASTGEFLGTGVTIPEVEDEFTELIVGLKLMLDDLGALDSAREKNQHEKIEVVKKTEEERRKLTELYSKELEGKVEQKTGELNRAKTHIETIIENLTSGLIEYDSLFTIVRINKTAEDMLGVSRKDVLGKRIEPKNIHERPEWKSLIEVSYPALSQSVRKITKEVSGVDADVADLMITFPLEREVQVTTLPIASVFSGDSKGFIKAIRDVTRERIIGRSKSEFISIAAHQLRTPLSAVKWAMRLLMDGDLGVMNTSQLKLLARGYETNEKMIRLVNDLLNISRIEDGRFGYRFNKANIIETIESIAANSSISAREHGINVHINPPPQPIQLFVFDHEKISLAFQNLIDNAIKYTQKGGVITVDIIQEDMFVKISVHDTGVGIPKGQIGRLFTKFFRADNVMHMQTSGSGLGLFIVKNIIARHGGKISVESDENKGSTFWFTLPLDENLIPSKDERVAYY
ncbi:MAG: ATP-binding protein [bacterium]|nr:ATP-binding protein [bacterium]